MDEHERSHEPGVGARAADNVSVNCICLAIDGLAVGCRASSSALLLD
jgi:hypothetical protein